MKVPPYGVPTMEAIDENKPAKVSKARKPREVSRLAKLRVVEKFVDKMGGMQEAQDAITTYSKLIS